MSILTDISENLQRGKAKVVKELVQQAIDEGVPAQQILDEATIDSNNIRLSAIAYTDDMLANLEQIMSGALNDAGEKYKSYISAVQSCYDVVTQNRNELAPQVAAAHTTDSVEDLDVSADDDEE